MNIRLGCRYWSMARSPWFPLLWVIVVDLFFITSDYTMQKILFYAWQAAFHMWELGVQRFSASVHMEPNSLVFESFPIILNDMKLFVESLLMCKFLFVFSTNLHPIMFPIPRLRTFSAFRYVLCLRRQIHRS